MTFWQSFALGFCGVLAYALVMIFVLSMCKAASDADKRMGRGGE